MECGKRMQMLYAQDCRAFVLICSIWLIQGGRMGGMSSYYNFFLSENRRNYISTEEQEKKKGSPPSRCNRKLHDVLDLIPHFHKFRNVVLLASLSISIYYFHFKCFAVHVITLAAGSGTAPGKNFLTVTRINKPKA